MQLDVAAEGVEVDGLVGFPGFRADQNRAAEGMGLDRTRYVDQREAGRESVQPLRAVDPLDADRRAEDVDVEIGPPRHLDVEVGVDDGVAGEHEPGALAAVGVDDDGARALGMDVERDAVEAFARRPADRVDDDFGFIAGGNRHVP